jgi:hypothetical protein
MWSGGTERRKDDMKRTMSYDTFLAIMVRLGPEFRMEGLLGHGYRYSARHDGDPYIELIFSPIYMEDAEERVIIYREENLDIKVTEDDGLILSGYMESEDRQIREKLHFIGKLEVDTLLTELLYVPDPERPDARTIYVTREDKS